MLQPRPSPVSRRLFLSMAATALAWPRGLAGQDSPFERIVRSRRPEDLEMPVAGFGDFITPIERFFVRTHVAVPEVRESEWQLKVDGEVSRALTLSLNDLRSMRS